MDQRSNKLWSSEPKIVSGPRYPVECIWASPYQTSHERVGSQQNPPPYLSRLIFLFRVTCQLQRFIIKPLTTVQFVRLYFISAKNKKLQMEGNKNEFDVAVVEEPVNIWKTIKLWEHRLVRMCSFQLQILLICGLVKGTFESTQTMFRALCLQMLILVYADSLSNQRDARNGDLVFCIVSSVIGFVCYFYMAAKLFSLILE